MSEGIKQIKRYFSFGKLFYYLCLSAVVIFVVYSVTNKTSWWQNILSRISPVSCVTPIFYNINQVDPQFNFKKEDLIIVSDEAAKYWNKQFSDFVLFSPSTSSGAIKINLVYDSRQAKTQDLDSLNMDISSGTQFFESLKSEYTSKKDLYDTDLLEYNNLVSEYEKMLSDYNDNVNALNKSGKITTEEVNKLEVSKSEIKKMAEEVSKKRVIINSQIDELNRLNEKIQAVVVMVNKQVENYNSSGLIDKEFEQGTYSSRGYTKEINIYQFDNREKLLKVIEHELGHALGLEHNQNINSVMYMINVDTSKQILPDDLSAIRKNCRQHDRLDILTDWIIKVLR